MDRKRFLSIALWLVVAVVIWLLFDQYPRLANFPAIFVLVPAIIIIAGGLYISKRAGKFSWNRRVYKRISAKHMVISALIVAPIAIAWMPATLSFARHDPTEILLFSIIPFFILGLFVSISLCIGLYYASGV